MPDRALGKRPRSRRAPDAARFAGAAAGHRLDMPSLLPTYHPRSDAVSSAGRAAHDIGAAALLGGNLFARSAMHPALRAVGDARERGQVTNGAWRRYGVVNGLSLAAVLAGWGGARAQEGQDGKLSSTERGLARAKDVAVVAVAVTGVASAIEGMRFNRTEPDGAVPLTDGDTAAPEATEHETRLKRRLRFLSSASLAAETALVAINAALAQQNFRRPPARRFLRS